MRHLHGWRKVACLFFLSLLPIFAQGTGTIIRVLPDQQATQEGGIIFTSRDGYPATEKSAILGAPSTMPSGTYSMRLPTNLEADTRCLQVTSAGQIELATGSCGVGSGGDVFTDQPNVFTASPQTIDITGDQARFHFISDYDNAGAAGVINGRSYSSTGGFGLVIKGFSMRGTEASPAATGSGQNLIWFGGGGHDGTVEAHNAAVITAKAISAWSGTNRGSYWSIFTTPDGSTSAAERFFFGLDSPGAITMLNDEPFYMRDPSGTPTQTLRLDSSDQLLIGSSGMQLMRLNTNVIADQDVIIEGAGASIPSLVVQSPAGQTGDVLRVLGNGATVLRVTGPSAGVANTILARSILPDSNGTYNVGASNTQFLAGYFRTMFLGASGVDNGELWLRTTTGSEGSLRGGTVTGVGAIEATDEFYPSSNNTFNLGLSTRKWGRIYAGTAFVGPSSADGHSGTCASTATLTVSGGIITGC